MKLGPVWLGRPSAAALDAALAAARSSELTYDHVGSTLDQADPSLHRGHRDLGRGQADFAAARDGLRTFVNFRGIRATVHPVGQEVEAGASIVIELGLGPVAVLAPDRVVAVVDEPTRYAYAYGTLQGHVEAGEESFSVELLDDGIVRATIAMQARPATLLTRLGGPFTVLLQRLALRRYLAALAAHVQAARRA